MNFLFIPFRIAYKTYCLVTFVLLFLVFYPVFYYLLRDSKRFSYAFILMRWLSLCWHASILAPVKVHGDSSMIRQGSFIICANHSSYMDIPAIYCVFKKYFVFIGKKEIENWPLFHIFYTSGMNITVDRDNPGESFDAFKRMLGEIDKGNPLAIFPEGTIAKNAPELDEFKSGAFSIAIRKQIPVLPVTFITNWERLQRKGLFSGKAGPGYSEMVIHPPIPTIGLSKKDTDNLQKMVREVINSPLKERFGCEV